MCAQVYFETKCSVWSGKNYFVPFLIAAFLLMIEKGRRTEENLFRRLDFNAVQRKQCFL